MKCKDCKHFHKDYQYCRLDKECRSKWGENNACAMFESNYQQTATWFIGEDIPYASTRKTKSLYLYRNEGNCVYTIARFSSPERAELFAKAFGFPLSEKIQGIINNHKENKK